MTRIRVYDNGMWDKIIDYYFDHVWDDSHNPVLPSWVEQEYNCKMIDRVAVFSNPADATMFQLRWQ